MIKALGALIVTMAVGGGMQGFWKRFHGHAPIDNREQLKKLSTPVWL